MIIGLADKVMTQLSDSYWLNTTQIIEIGPGNVRQVLHRDMTNYPVFVPLGPAAPHVMMNFLIALTEFREDNGGTRIIPGSNRWPDYLDLDDERDQARTIPVEMRPGDCLLLGGKVVHGGARTRPPTNTAAPWRSGSPLGSWYPSRRSRSRCRSTSPARSPRRCSR